jgi:FkbM family methyltransferase
VRKMIAVLSGYVPNWIMERIVGSQGHPSVMANVVHTVLNRLPGEPFPCLPCAGILEGFRMRVEWARFRAYVYGTWEPEVVRAVTEVVHEGFVAIDVGAHHGYYALILSRLVGPKGRVIAFEPVPPNFQILTENVDLNHCANVEVINKAVLDKSARLDASPRNEKDSASFSLLSNQNGQSIGVDAISLDDFLTHREGRINFIGIDAEGGEGMVLKGALKTIELHHPILLIEVHEGADLQPSQVPGLLMELGYELKWLSHWEGTSHVLASWKKAPSGSEPSSHRLCES